MSLIKKLLGLILLMVVLGGGVKLVEMNQDIRKEATVTDTVASIYPSTSVTELGKTIKVHVILNTGKSTDLLTGAEFKVSYGAGLKYSGNEILVKEYSILNSVIDDGNGTLTFKIVSMGAEKGGVIDLMTIDFTAKTNGSGELTVKEAQLMINGQSQIWEVKTYEKGTYQITSTGNVTPTATPTVKPTATVTPVVTVKPTVTPILNNGTNGILKFKITFAGVNSIAECASDWPVQVTVIWGSQSKVFSNIPLTVGETTNNGLTVYIGQVLLTGVVDKNNLAVFIKGPRHIQAKYGVNGQSTFYNKAGGEITVETDLTKTPMQDFTKYPMMAGDVVGEDGGQDGTVNGLDFVYVKNEVIKRSEGDNILADLNGNCKLESQDLSLLMQTLREKAEQLY